MKGKIFWMEPLLFLLFGAFHLHRIWALTDRTAYAAFWLGILEERGIFYFGLMGTLVLLCAAGLWVFGRTRGPWWRWIYLLGGGYVLFDLASIAAGWDTWHALLLWMFDVENPAWNWIWGGFSGLGLASLLFGLCLFYKKLHL